MVKRQPALPHAWPSVWIVSDARNDAVLEAALAMLPRGSGLIFRHYHLENGKRRATFAKLARQARRRGHVVVLSGSARLGRFWGADGVYASPRLLTRGPAGLRLVTAHSLREIAAARRARADAIVLSPVFATRSHPGARPLGPLRFRLMAARADLPVIALGGVNHANSRRVACHAWAGIDAFCRKVTRLNSRDS